MTDVECNTKTIASCPNIEFRRLQVNYRRQYFKIHTRDVEKNTVANRLGFSRSESEFVLAVPYVRRSNDNLGLLLTRTQ